ncbi:hypothetical protein L7F22_018362 [Adiantum nelumboides]|nr:hypothetical protein [Adiantum nelumboides]
MELGMIVGFILSIAFPLGVSFISALFSSGGESDWYKELKKPPWTPPNWVFPVVWTILYTLMGISSWLVWLHGGFKGQSLPLAAYTFQLLLNFLWTPIFFGLHQVGLALVEILLLWTAITATLYLFWHVNSLAAYLLIPYLLWRNRGRLQCFQEGGMSQNDDLAGAHRTPNADVAFPENPGVVRLMTWQTVRQC